MSIKRKTDQEEITWKSCWFEDDDIISCSRSWLLSTVTIDCFDGKWTIIAHGKHKNEIESILISCTCQRCSCIQLTGIKNQIKWIPFRVDRWMLPNENRTIILIFWGRAAIDCPKIIRIYAVRLSLMVFHCYRWCFRMLFPSVVTLLFSFSSKINKTRANPIWKMVHPFGMMLMTLSLADSQFEICCSNWSKRFNKSI